MWYVYVIHFDTPYKHAKHYTGIAKNPEKRFKEHTTGTGARLMQIIKQEKIPVVMYVVEQYDSYQEAHSREEQLKKSWKKPSRYCPACKPEAPYIKKFSYEFKEKAETMKNEIKALYKKNPKLAKQIAKILGYKILSKN